jgi:UDP-N-acetylglucosamine 4,6-dehydratase
MYNDKKILITGGTGTVGQEICRQLLKSYNPDEIRIFSRSEISQVEMKAKFDDKRLKFVIGDIRDEKAVRVACHHIDLIFHLAALKHVGICEEQPIEALKTNVNGAINIAEAAIHNSVERVINISTDKAVNPNSLYGHTKAVAEKLFAWANCIDDTQFMNVRSGNIFGSSGSVVPLFFKQIQQNREVALTNGDMTRFFVSVKEIAEYLILVMAEGDGPNMYIMNNPKSMKLRDLAEIIVEINWNMWGTENVAIKETGSRPGEKMHEELFTSLEKVYVLYPKGGALVSQLLGPSSNYVLTKDALKQWIHDNPDY